jgi:signal transduction histidine kinase
MSAEAASGSPVPDAASPEGLAPWRGDRSDLIARLAAGIAHELRNPLAVILARVQLLQLALKGGKPLPAARLEQSLGAVEDQALRASRVIENLSAFARPRPPEPAAVDLVGLVEHVLTQLQSRLPAGQGIAIDVEIRPEATSLVADRGQLATALSQLVVNAVEAMPGGGTLRIRADRREGSVEIRVADSGPGVAPHDAARIFDPFFSTKPSGSGLGLCVAQTIAEAHGGTVRLVRSGAVGSEFVLVLPAGG